MMLTKADEKWERLVLDLGVVVVLKDYPYTLPTQTLLLQSPAGTPPLRGALPHSPSPWSSPASEIHKVSFRASTLSHG